MVVKCEPDGRIYPAIVAFNFIILRWKYMNKIITFFEWLFLNFFVITLFILIIIFLAWFRLTPLMLNGNNDSDGAYVVGLILLGIYAAFVVLYRLSTNRRIIRTISSFFVIFLFFVFIFYLIIHLPSIEYTAQCNGNSYYTTANSPLGDEQWTSSQIAIWKGPFKYNSFFISYSGGPYKIICDQEKKEANIIDLSMNNLAYTDGANPRNYDRFVGTKLGSHLYFMSDKCNDWQPSTCASETYTLYECNLNYTSCDPLPIQYTAEYVDYLILEPDAKADGVNLKDDNTLIFTYGSHPRCFVDGCVITAQ
jgi:hypothetical protein